MDCVFCRIAAGTVPAKILKTTQSSIAFLDAFPLAKGHTLVIPKRHHAKIQDMESGESSDLFSLVRYAASKVDKITGATLVAIHNGKEAGQEIPHVHVHLVPRRSSDSAGPIHSMFGRVNLTDAEMEDAYRVLKE